MTIYQALQKSGLKFTNKDSHLIGHAVRLIAKPTGKIEQVEQYGEVSKTFMANNYSEKDAEAIYGAILKHFTKPKQEAQKLGKRPRKRIRIK